MEDLRGELEGLRKEVAELKAVLRATRRVLSSRGETFVEKVEQERARCERYNHFFALVSFECAREALDDVLERIRSVVRKVDVVGVISDGGDAEKEEAPDENPGGLVENPGKATRTGRVGAIMPETDRTGALAASTRALAALEKTREGGVLIAVYPDDATDARELVRLVAG